MIPDDFFFGAKGAFRMGQGSASTKALAAFLCFLVLGFPPFVPKQTQFARRLPHHRHHPTSHKGGLESSGHQ